MSARRDSTHLVSVAMYLLLALAGGFVVWQYQQRLSAVKTAEAAVRQASAVQARLAENSRSTTASTGRSFADEQSDRRITHLTTLLKQRSEEVESLQRKVAELKRGGDPTQPKPATSAASASALSTAEAKPAGKSSSETPQNASAKTDSNDDDALAEYRQRSEEEMNELREANTRLTNVLQERESLQVEASALIVQVGSAAVPALSEALESRQSGVREWAATLLGEIGSDARDALPSLLPLLNDPEERVRTAARMAVAAIERN